MAVLAVKPTLLVHKFWLSLCCGSSTASFLLLSQAALAQSQPPSIDLQGYDRYLKSHQHLRQDPIPFAAADSDAPLRLAQADLETAPSTSPPIPAEGDLDPLEEARLQRLLAEGAAAVSARSEDVSARLHALVEDSSSPQLLAQALPSPPPATSPLLTESLPILAAVPPEAPKQQAESENQPESESLSTSQIDQLLADGAAAIAQAETSRSPQEVQQVAASAPTQGASPVSPEPETQVDPIPPQPETTLTTSANSLSDVSTDAASLQPQRSPSRTIRDPALAVLAPLLLAPDAAAEPEPPTPTFAKGALAPFPVAQAQPPSAPAILPGVLTPAGLTPSILQKFPLFQPPPPTQVASPPQSTAPALLPTISTPITPSDLTEKFPLFQGVPAAAPQDQQPFAPSLPQLSGTPQASPYAPSLLSRFPLPQLMISSGSGSGGPGFDASGAQLPEMRGSQIRQQLETNLQTQVPLDPDQLNVTGDNLSFDAEQEVGIAEGNARIQLSDGTTITGDKLLFYQREKRLRSEGPFLLEQASSQGGERQIKGRNLDFDITSRSAQFESSLVILPGEEPGTKIFVRSEETTALLGDQIFFENATITTSPEPPVTHYVKGDRVEVFPDDKLLVYDARVFGGGALDEQGDIGGGTQIGYFPLFVYSLQDHQWILPGQSGEEGIYVKSSWAYRFDQYNFGGLRLDLIERKGLGIGFTHDYIVPIQDSENYGRAQFYLVTERDENRLSSRFRVDHFFDFYAANILGNYGDLRGQLNVDLDNTYRPAGGRNDASNFRLNSTFRADLSTTTLNFSRTGSPTRGTYNLPLTVSHDQRYDGVPWLSSNMRIDYNQRLSARGAQDFSDTRLTVGTRFRPPGWGGDYQVNYRAYSSSNGDLESRKNFEFIFNPTSLTLSRDISFTTNLTLTQNQSPDAEANGLNFFNKYEARSSLRFADFQPFEWITITPGSIEYYQALYSTPDQESTLTMGPQLSIEPSEWANLDMRFQRVFQGNNSVPFQSVSSNPRDTHRINANLSFFTPRSTVPNVPPGYVAFEDDLPGELPIALTFPDDTTEDLDLIANRTEEELQAEVKNLFRFDTSTGFDYVSDRWDLINATFTWNTTPNLFDVRLSTSYDPNEGELNPIQLTYTGRTSTTFERGLRSGLDFYEPGVSYSLRAVYDPEEGDLSSYGVDLDATIGNRWQNHWGLRLGVDQEGLQEITIRRDLRDFEVRLTYDPSSELLRLEGFLVAFPSRPVGLTQERGDFLFASPSSIGSGELLP